MIEIKITTENVAEMHAELKQLLFGNDTVAQPTIKQDTPVIPIKKEEEKPLEEKPKRSPRKPKEEVKQEETKTEEAVEETKTEEAVEETKTEEAVEETQEETGFTGDFEGLDEAGVINKVRAYINTFNQAAPGNTAKAKAIFAAGNYGVKTVPSLSAEQAIDFYNKLKAI